MSTQVIFPVSSSKNEGLERAMKRLGVRESDWEESFVRSRGPGGQNVNKVSTCVILKHLSTGLTVKCQRERSQAMNRYWARRILIERLESQVLGKQSEEAQRIAKIKRQKRKRSRRAKNKVLALKQQHSEKKQLRQRVKEE
jgi:protein subunit release factor B